MDYLETIKTKRQGKLDSDKEQAFTDSLGELSSDIRVLLASLETSGAKKLDRQVVEAISSLGTIVEALSTLKVESDSEVKETLRTIATNLGNLDIRPVVNVPKAQVTVQEREIDFDPLINALNKEPTKETDDDPLAGYKAQDINNDDPNIQYVGFVNAQGNWYIIQNDDSSLRYKFGVKGYTKAFKDCAKLSYKLYSEAIGEIKA